MWENDLGIETIVNDAVVNIVFRRFRRVEHGFCYFDTIKARKISHNLFDD